MRMLEKIEQYIDSCIEAGDIYGASFSLITLKVSINTIMVSRAAMSLPWA